MLYLWVHLFIFKIFRFFFRYLPKNAECLNQLKWPYLNRLKIQIHTFLKWIDSDSQFKKIKSELIQFWIDSRLNLTNIDGPSLQKLIRSKIFRNI